MLTHFVSRSITVQLHLLFDWFAFNQTGKLYISHPRPGTFGLFKQTIQQINVKKCSSSIRCRDLNPQPLEYKSSPITTRLGASHLIVGSLSTLLLIYLGA